MLHNLSLNKTIYRFPVLAFLNCTYFGLGGFVGNAAVALAARAT